MSPVFRLSRLSPQAFERGRVVAELLSAAVSGRTPRGVSTRDLADVAPVLVRSGAAPLAFWGLRASTLAVEPAVELLHDVYRAAAGRAVAANGELEELFADLSAAGLDVIIGKGWSVARVYEAIGLRPYGDFDLYCRRDDCDRLRAVLGRRSGQRVFGVDAHQGLSYLDDRDADVVFRRSTQIGLGSTMVRVFGAEDQLRLSCLHALAEGLIRPIWLCDIALLTAAAPPDFDWEYFSSGAGRRGEWCRAAVALAHAILGADTSRLPVSIVSYSLPRWLGRSALATWGCGLRSKGWRTPMDRVERGPAAMVRALVERWPLPIEATVGVGGRIDAVPRLPYEVAEVVRRSVSYFRR